jgi:PPOX class probable F420-dependent enzyme
MEERPDERDTRGAGADGGQARLMAYRPMADEEVRSFLTALPARTAKLATVRPDGRPHLAPVWYDVDDDGSLVLNTGDPTVKGRNLRRDPRLSLCVDDDRPPFSFVVVEGVAEISDDLDAVRRWAGRIGGRYMGADRAEEFGDRNGVAGELLVRVLPERIVSALGVAD